MSKRFRLDKVTAKAAVGVMAVTGGLSLLGAQAAPAATANPGGPAIITTSDFFTPLNSGTAATVWSIKLPQAASCSGDTATNNFHVFTYVVPASVDPGTLRFGSDGPENDPNADFPLVDDGGSPQIALNTGIGTGQVPVPLPRFQWGNPPTPFDSTLIPPGTYNVGIACADGAGVNDKFWNVQETFTGDPTVFTGPNAFAWTVSTTTSTSTSTSTMPATTTTTMPATTTTTMPATTTTTVAPDTTPPTCFVSAVRAGPPKQLDLTAQDTGSGLASITVVSIYNGTASVPAFTPGTTSSVVATFTKTDQTKPTVVYVDATDLAGNTTHCR